MAREVEGSQTRDQSARHEPEETGRGLYGTDMGGQLARTAVAELVGTFIVVLTGIAVAVAGLLDRPTAGDSYDSLAVALAFGLAVAWAGPPRARSRDRSGSFTSAWVYIVGPVVGAIAAAFLYDKFLGQTAPPGDEPAT